jgi:hypothetical protein
VGVTGRESWRCLGEDNVQGSGGESGQKGTGELGRVSDNTLLISPLRLEVGEMIAGVGKVDGM